MINLEKAIEIFINKYKYKYLADICETPYNFLIGGLGDNGEELTEPPTAINKKTGETSVFIPPHHVEEWLARKELEIPEQYRYHGEIKY